MIQDGFIPQPKRNKTGWPEFIAKHKTEYDAVLDETKNVGNIYNSVRTKQPAQLSQMVGANTVKGDTPRQIRVKAGRAVYTVKNHGIFTRVWQPIIDDITGLTSSVWKGFVTYGSFVVGESIIGSGAMIGHVSALDEIKAQPQAGEIHINLGGVVTDELMAQVVDQLRDYAPPYFIIFLGWTTTVNSNIFVVASSKVEGLDTLEVGGIPIETFKSKKRII